MFTGIVERTGRVDALVRGGAGARLLLGTDAAFAAEVATGESIAVNGCCLTATRRAADERADLLAFDVLAQSLRVTALGDLAPNATVNVERALAADGRIGGHFVQGHVDAAGEILALERVGDDHRLEVGLPRDLLRLVIPKGSIAIDGISLTVAEIDDARAAVTLWITPHTFAATNLVDARPGRRVNVECDMLAKHLARLVERAERAAGAAVAVDSGPPIC